MPTGHRTTPQNDQVQDEANEQFATAFWDSSSRTVVIQLAASDVINAVSARTVRRRLKEVKNGTADPHENVVMMRAGKTNRKKWCEDRTQNSLVVVEIFNY